MHRRIAQFLLLLALMGNLAPAELALAAPPPHACCLRKTAHHCHDSVAAEAKGLDVRAASCCNHDCCRAVTTAQWAHAQPPVAASFSQNVEAYLGQSSRLS